MKDGISYWTLVVPVWKSAVFWPNLSPNGKFVVDYNVLSHKNVIQQDNPFCLLI